MKKALYIILLVVEFVAGFGLLMLVSGGAVGWPLFGIVAAVWAVLTALLLVKLKKAEQKRKFKVLLALVMLIPLLGAIGGLVGFIWAFAAAGLI